MLWIMIVITILIILSLLKAIISRTIIDRLISINAITTLVSVFILLLAFLKEEPAIIDIALVFMLCAFVGGLWIIRAFVPVDWEPKLPEIKKEAPSNENTDI